MPENMVIAAIKVMDQVQEKSREELEVWCRWGVKLQRVDCNVSELGRMLEEQYDYVPISLQTFKNNSTAAKKLAAKFGTVAKIEAAINEYNATAWRPAFKVVTLAEKLCGGTPSPKKPSALHKRMVAAVEAGIITQRQAELIEALEVK